MKTNNNVSFADWVWFAVSLTTGAYFLWNIFTLSFNPHDYAYISSIIFVGMLPIFATTGIFIKSMILVFGNGNAELKKVGTGVVLWSVALPASIFLIAGVVNSSLPVALLAFILVYGKVREIIKHSIASLVSAVLAIFPAIIIAMALDRLQFTFFAGRQEELTALTEVINSSGSFSAGGSSTILIFGLLSSSFILCDTVIDFFISVLRKKLTIVVDKGTVMTATKG